MTEEKHHSQNEYPRVRFNIKQLAKGELRFDSTYEDVGRPWQEVLADSDAMTAALVERYPAPEA